MQKPADRRLAVRSGDPDHVESVGGIAVPTAREERGGLPRIENPKIGKSLGRGRLAHRGERAAPGGTRDVSPPVVLRPLDADEEAARADPAAVLLDPRDLARGPVLWEGPHDQITEDPGRLLEADHGLSDWIAVEGAAGVAGQPERQPAPLAGRPRLRALARRPTRIPGHRG